MLCTMMRNGCCHFDARNSLHGSFVFACMGLDRWRFGLIF